MKKKKKEYNYNRQIVRHCRNIYEQCVNCMNLIDLFPKGILSVGAYINLEHCHCCYDKCTCGLNISICWEVPETDDEYNQRIRDYEIEKQRRKESAEKRAKITAIKAEKAKLKEIKLLKQLKEKYPNE